MAHHHGSQEDRDRLLRHFVHLLPGGRRAGRHDAPGTGGAGSSADLGACLQRVVHDPRHHDDLPVRGPVRGGPRQLPDPAADRRARHGVPPRERAVVLVLRGWRAARPPLGIRRGRGRGGDGLDALSAPVRGSDVPGGGARPPDPRAGPGRDLDAPQRREHPHDDLPDAGARHDDVAAADLHVEHDRHRDPRPRGLPSGGRRLRPPAPGSQAGRACVRPIGRRRSGDLPAPVLVPGAPGGVHPDPAVLRRDHRDHPGLQPQAALRIHGVRAGDAGDRCPVHRRVGAPHVHDRRRRQPLLLGR